VPEPLSEHNNIGKMRFKKLNETILVPGANIHKNTGRCNAAMLEETMKAVIFLSSRKGRTMGGSLCHTHHSFLNEELAEG
jgi:hypothetical protein